MQCHTKLGDELKVTNLKRQTGNEFIDLSGNQADVNKFGSKHCLLMKFGQFVILQKKKIYPKKSTKTVT